MGKAEKITNLGLKRFLSIEDLCEMFPNKKPQWVYNNSSLFDAAKLINPITGKAFRPLMFDPDVISELFPIGLNSSLKTQRIQKKPQSLSSDKRRKRLWG